MVQPQPIFFKKNNSNNQALQGYTNKDDGWQTLVKKMPHMLNRPLFTLSALITLT